MNCFFKLNLLPLYSLRSQGIKNWKLKKTSLDSLTRSVRFLVDWWSRDLHQSFLVSLFLFNSTLNWYYVLLNWPWLSCLCFFSTQIKYHRQNITATQKGTKKGDCFKGPKLRRFGCRSSSTVGAAVDEGRWLVLCGTLSTTAPAVDELRQPKLAVVGKFGHLDSVKWITLV